jgi:hypothetical protein
MRIVKLSKGEFGTLDDVRRFFFGELRRRTPPGKFRVTHGRIAEGALKPGEPLVFTYDKRVVFTARAGSGLEPNDDQECAKYPSYFAVDLDSLREADTVLRDVQLRYNETSGACVTIAGSQGWNDLPDSAHTEDLWAWLRAPADFTLPQEIPDWAGVVEGGVCKVSVDHYERNPAARRICIAQHGTDCSVCGFNFGAAYGEPAQGFIDVHHLRPLSEIRHRHVVKPKEDLRPVCPNCHAVLHRRKPPYTIEEVQTFLRQRGGA